MLPDAFGLVKTTLLDFPGLVAAVVFTPGCNLRCPWCQNPGLVQAPWEQGLLPRSELLEFLDRRRPVLQGVVFTGGEPLFHPATTELIAAAKALGYQVKLDTNGTLPHLLEKLDPALLDYVAMDLKNAPSRYGVSAGVALPGGVTAPELAQTLALLRRFWPRNSEVRLTWVPGLNRLEDLDELARFLGPGLPLWVQGYRPGPVLAPETRFGRAPTPAELDEVAATLQALGIDATVR